MTFPAQFDTISRFAKVVFVKTLRPDCLSQILKEFIIAELG